MSLQDNTERLLESGLKQLGLTINPDLLIQYLLLLSKWNRTYNLTAVRNLDDMVIKHLLDSLAILPWIYGKRIIDVGAGAGLPGIPLAIANPSLEIVLLDSNGKKVRFMQEAKRLLHLDNVIVEQSRVETYRPTLGFDTVMSRAFSSLAQMITWTQQLVAPSGIWLAMKGRYPEDELQGISFPYQVKAYSIPGLEGERCCVIIKNNKTKE
ncbi:glucose inhibited division protein B GidB [Legionella busanensis]|uniref:Ribosomal RNA small subunit methyltransferase G n=1 Tax=Legionella busanensis TaxID=190655 RepID=A0A378JGC6_9GAMM|nr:glucose inhibited division protein B GidB [Legionella busanensis]